MRFRMVALILVLVLSGCSGAATAPAAAPTAAGPAAGAGTSPLPAGSAATSPLGAQSSPLSSSPVVTPAAGLTPITLAMGYVPSVQFAPFYVAQARGYFREAGLDVKFQYGQETDLIKLVGTNQLQYMIGSGEEVVLGRSQGVPVRYVMRWYQRFPVVLFALPSSGIKTPKDLVGKRVGIPALSGASYIGWRALAYGAGIDPNQVHLDVVGYTQAAAVTQGRVDAALDYAVSGPVQLKLAGQTPTVISVSDYFDLPSNGIITNDQTVRDHPDQVRALVQATLHGLRDTLADPNAAFAASIAAVPEAGGAQEAVNRAIFDAALQLWQADAATLGQSSDKAWADAASFMAKDGLIPQPVQAGDLYTNQFVTH